MIVVSGRLQIRPWEDKNGNKRYSTEIIVGDVYFGGSKRSAATDADATQNAVFEELDGGNDELPWKDDDLPFTVGKEDELPL